jgi:prepilin-type processing-associated H-X9-DG protein
VTLTLGDNAEELARVRALLTPPIAAVSMVAQRNQRINQFKQLALAYLNYESTHRELAGQANYDQAGKPLLSWRVHLLPYFEEKTLYDEFRLDEPWDSPHNRKLIERMPEVYADPNPGVRRQVGAGRTTFVAPVAKETLFPPRQALPDGKPLTIRDVRDGTSKTILFVEVVPQRGVVWTKPEDWNVDLGDPLQGVIGAQRSGFIVAYCDGHVRLLMNNIDGQEFAKNLTRAGGEPTEW